MMMMDESEIAELREFFNFLDQVNRHQLDHRQLNHRQDGNGTIDMCELRNAVKSGYMEGAGLDAWAGKRLAACG